MFVLSFVVFNRSLPASAPVSPPNFFGIRTYEKRARNPFRIRTCKSLDLKSFRIRTYKKTPGGGAPVDFPFAVNYQLWTVNCPPHFPSASSSNSFFFSASRVITSSEATYPATAAAAKNAKISAGSHTFPVSRPANRIGPHTAPNTNCAPNATSTAIPDCREPFILPNSIFFGNVSDDQLARLNCPTTANTTPASVAHSTGADGSPIRHPSTAAQSAISVASRPVCIRFFPSSTSRNRSGSTKYVCIPRPSYAKQLYAGAIRISSTYAIIAGKNMSGLENISGLLRQFPPGCGPANCIEKNSTRIGGKISETSTNPFRSRYRASLPSTAATAGGNQEVSRPAALSLAARFFRMRRGASVSLNSSPRYCTASRRHSSPPKITAYPASDPGKIARYGSARSSTGFAVLPYFSAAGPRNCTPKMSKRNNPKNS